MPPGMGALGHGGDMTSDLPTGSATADSRGQLGPPPAQRTPGATTFVPVPAASAAASPRAAHGGKAWKSPVRKLGKAVAVGHSAAFGPSQHKPIWGRGGTGSQPAYRAQAASHGQSDAFQGVQKGVVWSAASSEAAKQLCTGLAGHHQVAAAPIASALCSAPLLQLLGPPLHLSPSIHQLIGTVGGLASDGSTPARLVQQMSLQPHTHDPAGNQLKQYTISSTLSPRIEGIGAVGGLWLTSDTNAPLMLANVRRSMAMQAMPATTQSNPTFAQHTNFPVHLGAEHASAALSHNNGKRSFASPCLWSQRRVESRIEHNPAPAQVAFHRKGPAPEAAGSSATNVSTKRAPEGAIPGLQALLAKP